MSRSSSSYSQHSQLLETRKVILMDPSDVVAVELPSGTKERGNGEMYRVDPRPVAQLRAPSIPSSSLSF